MKLEFRPYQKEAIELGVRRKHLLLALTMGAGKTAVALSIMRELRGQDDSLQCVVFATNSLKYQWAAEIKKWDPGATYVVIDGDKRKRRAQYFRAEESDYTLLSYDMLIHDWDLIRHHLPYRDVVVADECFPAGTMVDTPSGAMPIETIQPGDKVTNAVGVGAVRAVSRRGVTELVRVVFCDGREVLCTPSHKFFTTEGWQEARILRHGDAVFEAEEALRVVRGDDACLPDLPLDRSRPAVDRQVLREILLGEVEDAAARGAGGGLHRGAATEDLRQVQGMASVPDPGATQGACTAGPAGLDRGVGGAAEANVEGQRQHDLGSEGQRDRANGGGAGSGRQAPGGMGVEPRHLPREEASRVPDELQGRRWTQATEAGGRGGWEVPPGPVQTGSGSQEGANAGVAWVDRVEVLQSADIGGPRPGSGRDRVDVFNLDVEGHPSYSVNGLLVHNCTMIKGFDAKRTKRLKFLTQRSESRIGLSGQPVENRPEELFSIMEFIDPEVLGSFHQFDRTFITRNSWGKVVRYKNLDVLHRRLTAEGAMFRKSREDIAEYLPERQETEVPVPLTGTARSLYEYMAVDLIDVIDRASESGTFGKFNLAAHYGHEAGDEQSNWLRGQIMSRMTAMRLLTAHPRLLLTSADDFDDEETASGSAYASQLKEEGRLTNLPDRSPKLDALIDLVEEIFTESMDQKVVLFSGFKPVLKLIGEELVKRKIGFTSMTGDTSSRRRQERITRFNTDPSCRLFLSSDAGAYGVNLDSGTHLLNYDLPWSAGALDQRVARIDRTSSKHEKIQIMYLYTAMTIEERQYHMLKEKARVADAFVDGKGYDPKGGILELGLGSLREFLEHH